MVVAELDDAFDVFPSFLSEKLSISCLVGMVPPSF